MKFFAIRHKPTGHYLPQVKRSRGFTADEPSAGPPRLFRTEIHARVALDWWLRGVTATEWAMRYEEGYPCGEEPAGLKSRPVPSRRADDMEVVAVSVRTERGGR